MSFLFSQVYNKNMGFFSKVAGSFVKDRVSNTTAALQLIIEDFKRYIKILKYIFLFFSLATIVYNIITKAGNLIINCSLIGVLILYSILDAIFKRRENPDPSKKLRIIYAWIKILLNAAALSGSLYPLYSATSAESIRPYSIVLTTLSLIMFILKVLVEICLDIFSSKWKFLKSAMILDAQEFPNTSGKIFSPLIGEVENVEVKESIINKLRKRQNR